MQAGYPNASAVPIFLGVRIFLPVVLIVASLIVLQLAGFPIAGSLLITAWFGILGYVAPALRVSLRRKARHEADAEGACPTRSTCWWSASRRAWA